MEGTVHRRRKRWPGIALGLVCVALLGLVAGCQSTAQVTGCGWSVWRYDTFNVVWASISNLLNLDRLNDSATKSVMCGGYVAADPTGQGCLSRAPECTMIWVWQNSGWTFGSDVLSACSKGVTSAGCSASSTMTVKDCAVKIVTKPANITVSSIVTVADDQDSQLTLVIVHEGKAVVQPRRTPETEVSLGAGQAAYFVSLEMSPERMDAMARRFGFPPNQPVPLDQVVPVIETLNWTPQIRRANAVVIGEGELVPLPIPFAWSLRSLDEQLTVDAANGLAVGWRSAVQWEALQDMPFVYQAWLDKDIAFIRQLAGPDVNVPAGADYGDLREIPGNAGVGLLRDALKKAGYDPGKELVLLVAEESMEALGGIADRIAGELNAGGLPATTKAVNSQGLAAVSSEWRAAGHPVFLLTWY